MYCQCQTECHNRLYSNKDTKADVYSYYNIIKFRCRLFGVSTWCQLHCLCSCSTQVKYWDEQKCESIKRSNAWMSLQGNMRTYTSNAAAVREQAGKI